MPNFFRELTYRSVYRQFLSTLPPSSARERSCAASSLDFTKWSRQPRPRRTVRSRLDFLARAPADQTSAPFPARELGARRGAAAPPRQRASPPSSRQPLRPVLPCSADCAHRHHQPAQAVAQDVSAHSSDGDERRRGAAARPRGTRPPRVVGTEPRPSVHPAYLPASVPPPFLARPPCAAARTRSAPPVPSARSRSLRRR